MRRPSLIATVALCCLGLSLTSCGATSPTGTSSPRPVEATTAPAPAPTLATDVLLGDTDNRTSVQVTVGETIGLRLHDDAGALGSLGWVNPTVLSTTSVVRGGSHDLTALFRAAGEGQADITIMHPCAGMACSAALRYQVTVVVTRPR